MFVGQHRRAVSLTHTPSSSSSTPLFSTSESEHQQRPRLYDPNGQRQVSRTNRTPHKQDPYPLNTSSEGTISNDFNLDGVTHFDNFSNNMSNHNSNSCTPNGNDVDSSSLSVSPSLSSSFVIDMHKDDRNDRDGADGNGGSFRTVFAMQGAWKRLSRTKRNVILAGLVALILFLVYYRFVVANDNGGWSSHRLMAASSKHALTSPPMLKYGPASAVYDIALVADRDSFSYNANRKHWASSLLQGELQRHVDANGKTRYSFSLDQKKIHEVTGVIVEKKRGMELSELQWFGNKLYTVDDRTGIVYEVKMDPTGKRKPFVLQRYILPDGDGESSAKGFKCEWMTVKDDILIVGSMGKEWTDGKTGAIISESPMWIKSISHQQTVSHNSFTHQYRLLMDAAIGAENREKGGYLVHEAVSWSDYHRRWFFLPRRMSKESYNEDADVYRGANIIISTDEHFNDIRIVNIQQNTASSRGFSTFKFVPHRPNEIVAIKSEEVGKEMRSFITVLTIDGQVLLPETQFVHEKIEGIEFV